MFGGVKYGYIDEYTAPLLLQLTRRFALNNDDAARRDPEYFNKLVRGLLPPRGARFSHDHHDTCVYIERSKNANLVVYQVNLVDAQTGQAVTSGAGRMCRINEKDPVHAHWLKIEPSYLERRQQQGKSDFEELNMIERKLAYGCNVKPIDVPALPAELCGLEDSWKKEAVSERVMMWWSALQPFIAQFVALPTHPGLVLRLPPLASADTASTKESFARDDTVVVAISLIDKTLSIITHIYVKSVEPKHFYQLPSVEYIELFGISLESGKETYEKILH